MLTPVRLSDFQLSAKGTLKDPKLTHDQLLGFLAHKPRMPRMNKGHAFGLHKKGSRRGDD